MSYIRGKNQPKLKGKSESIAIENSSFLAGATFDPSNSSLTINIKNGTQISYTSFSQVAWDQFKQSPSKGSFYSRLIKGKDNVSFMEPLKVSDLEKAIKEYRLNAKFRKHSSAPKK